MSIAIVSTHDIDCGIARFAEVLRHGLATEGAVSILDLPRHELKPSYGATRRSGDRYIAALCERLAGFDAVSIQFEYSLLADNTKLSVRRLERLAQANPNTCVTLHTVLSRSSSSDLRPPSIIRWLSSPRHAFGEFLGQYRSARLAKLEAGLLGFLRRRRIKVVVHTRTTQELLRQRYGLSQVYCHPLCYTSAREKQAYDHATCRSELLHKLGLEGDVRLVGVFGFFGNYKGFDYAVRCLAALPANHRLLVFSGLHPNVIRHSDNSQIEHLLALGKRLKVLGRICFMGTVDDRSLYRAIAGVDVSWLPYREVGQEASAICSEVSELSQRVIVSRNFAFIDYMKFGLRKTFEFCEIGNVEELRLKTLNYDHFHPQDRNATEVQDHAERQAAFYRNVLQAAPERVRHEEGIPAEERTLPEPVSAAPVSRHAIR